MDYSPSELARLYKVSLHETSGHNPERLQENHSDFRQIKEMVIYLGYYPLPESNQRESECDRKGVDHSSVHHYTCKNFQNGECSIYEFRPRMCRSFPYGKKCPYRACRWSAVNGEEQNIAAEDTYDSDDTLSHLSEAGRRALKQIALTRN